ncbi:MAG: glycosyltransferase [Candidatus Omnitrophota bacterium]|jgi:glycosyltransferase involved in cell wall biosynthesis
MNIKSLVIIAARYPCNQYPIWHVFVRQIAHSFARQGVKVTVISPLSIHRALVGRDPFRITEDAGEGVTITVFRPKFFSMSNYKIGPWNSFELTVSGIHRAAKRVLCEHMKTLPDAIYGHFMYPAGAVAVRLGAEFGIPAFPAAGEISLDTVFKIGVEKARKELSSATAFIANSSHLAGLMKRTLGIETHRIKVLPNGFNRRIFFPREKAAMRQKYSFPTDRFLVAFVGSFEKRKGPRRVARAIQNITGVSGVFVGGGNEVPQGDNVLFCRRVPHEQVPEILSACDLFVLPTTDEGCCNAIVEAMACGLPVISSTGAFNDEILNPEVSIRINPLDISAIHEAIIYLRDNPETRGTMSRAALAWSMQFDSDQRAQRILQFMTNRIES